LKQAQRFDETKLRCYILH